MLEVNHAPRRFCPADVSLEMRKAASSRRGEWEVCTFDNTYRKHGAVGCFSTLTGHIEIVKTTIRLKESELPRLCHMYWHGHRNETKIQSMRANMEQVAQTLWPTGSLEDMAMRMLAPAMLTRALAGHRIRNRDPTDTGMCCWAGPCSLMTSMMLDPNKYLTTLLRCSDAGGPQSPPCKSSSSAGDDDAKKKDDKSPTTGGKKGGDTPKTPPPPPPPAPDSAPIGAPPGLPTPTAPPAAAAPPSDPIAIGASTVPHKYIGPERDPSDGILHGGATPSDADILAETTQRTIDRGGVVGITGQDYDKTETSADRQQIVGAVLMPLPGQPNVYNNTAGNCEAAKRKRLVEKHVPYTGTKADRAKIGKFIKRSMSDCKKHGVFSAKRIQAWAEEFFHIKELLSKKWSNAKMENAIEQALAQAFPEINLKGAVKLEPMPEGKAPRLIIADGEMGQLFAVCVVKCFEDLLFSWFEQKSIKKVSKRDAIKRAMDNLRKKGAGSIEGDGSAWDTTNNKDIRGMIDNPVLKHIFEHLAPYSTLPDQWHMAHLHMNEKKKLKLMFTSSYEKVKLEIDAIRRSGCRGTSCLNWWMNFTNWACSIFKEPERFLDPTVRWGEDVTGVMRWWNGCFEGDDSWCALKPKMNEGDDLSKEFEAWWTRQGFRMKIVYVDDRATFCGYWIGCCEGEPSNFACPEIKRALQNAGVSTSSGARVAARDGNLDAARDLAAAAALARAADFAGLVPSISRKYHEYARSVKRSRDIKDREMSMRVAGEDGHTFNEIEASIEAANNLVTPYEEQVNLKLVCSDATPEELDAFTLYPWEFDRVRDYDAFKASLPGKWR